jgi:hypothetical protein
MMKKNRMILKVTSIILLVLAVLSITPLVTSLMTVASVFGQLTPSKESMEFTLYVLIIGLLGVVSLALQFMASVKGLKASSGKDYPDNCKTYGTLLIILQIASMIINIVLGGFEMSQLIGNGLSLILLFLYTRSAAKLIY